LTSVGGPPNGTVFDWIMQEIDVATNKVIWEWHALGHIPVSYSYEPYIPGQTYDYFHLNSIQQLNNGHIIISARHTFAVYAIDRKTGKVYGSWAGSARASAWDPGRSSSGSRTRHCTTAGCSPCSTTTALAAWANP